MQPHSKGRIEEDANSIQLHDRVSSIDNYLYYVVLNDIENIYM